MKRFLFFFFACSLCFLNTTLLQSQDAQPAAAAVEPAATEKPESTQGGTDQPAAEGAPITRAERLRQHEERVRRIIEDRRKARAASEGGEVATDGQTPPPAQEQAATSNNDFGNMILYNVFRVEEGTALVTGGNKSVGNVAGSRQQQGNSSNEPVAIITQNETSFDSNQNNPNNQANSEIVSNRAPIESFDTGSTSGDFTPGAGQAGMLTEGDSKSTEFDYALDTIIRKGDRFVSEVRLQNSQAKEFDRFRIALRYDKRFLRPIKVFDQGIRGTLKSEPKFEIVDRDSLLVYEGEFSKTRITKELVLLNIVWEAILPTEYTQLNFAFAGAETDLEPHTGIYFQEANVLGESDDPYDGVLGGSILILKAFDPTEEDKADITQGKQEELRNIYLANVGGQNPVGLKLIGPDFTPAVGETFLVDVYLNNPGGAVVDSLKFFILFDPAVVQVVDQDMGNWIRRGVNVHDGPFRLRYPFDYHKYNEADNQRGRIRYGMSMGRTLTLPTGPFATIHLRALAPSTGTSIAFAKSQGSTDTLTDVQILGYSVFTEDPDLTTPELFIPILAAREKGTKDLDLVQQTDEFEPPYHRANSDLMMQMLNLP